MTFWRSLALVLGVLLGMSVLVNVSGAYEVPRQVTLFLFGTLVALGVGYTIVNPKSSPASTRRGNEGDFRRRQFAAGIGMSVVLAASFLFKEVRNSPLVWVLYPIIVLPFVLVVREYVLGARRAGERNRKPGRHETDVRRESAPPQ